MGKDILKTTILGFFSGLLISVGCIVNLASGNKFVGALAFSCGLFFICECGFKLYTGAIGYAFDNAINKDHKSNLMLLFILIGNFIGCLFAVGLIRVTRMYDVVNTNVQAVVNAKMNDTWYSVFVLAILCGLLIYLGVDTFKKSKNNCAKVMALIYCVFVFIISGYEHCIANMFYIMVSNTWSLKAVLYVVIMIIGNSVGGLLIPGLKLLIREKKNNEEEKNIVQEKASE